LIEAKNYRFYEHQVGLNTNNDRAYRTHEEIRHYQESRDPLVHFRDRLLKNGVSEEELSQMESEAEGAVREAIRFAEQSAPPAADDVYRNMYAIPINYPPQRFEGMT
jgi:acetoin:2,6-dichlorophenolindophenol oxidoreductase subunit alpha